jgi:hypothetical protein
MDRLGAEQQPADDGAPAAVAGLVDGDGPEPGAERPRRIVTAQRSPGGDEGFRVAS